MEDVIGYDIEQFDEKMEEMQVKCGVGLNDRLERDLYNIRNTFCNQCVWDKPGQTKPKLGLNQE